VDLLLAAAGFALLPVNQNYARVAHATAICKPRVLAQLTGILGVLQLVPDYLCH
jgi:hypothetical protein